MMLSAIGGGAAGGTTAAARASEVALAELRGRAPPLVLLFERMDESLALLADALGAPLQAAVVPHMKHRPHRTAAEWPAFSMTRRSAANQGTK